MITLKLCLIFTLSSVCLLFCIYLLLCSPNSKRKFWLAVTFISLTFINGIELLFYFPTIKNYLSTHLSFVFFNIETIQMTIIPALAIYLFKFHSNTKTNWKYFLPAMLCFVYSLFKGFNSQTSIINNAVCHRDLWSLAENYYFITLQILQIIYYITVIPETLKNSQYDIQTKNYHKVLFKIVIVCNIVYIVDYVFALRFREHLLLQVYMYIFYLFASLLTYIVLFLLEAKHDFILQTLGQITKKYSGSNLTIKRIEQIKFTIEEYMETQKPYLNPDFTLEMMSESILIQRNHISQLINETYNMNFREYINMYRIKESIRLMNDENEEDLNINQIFYESGFNSKSVFNTAFKKQTNMTPSEYRKNISNHVQFE